MKNTRDQELLARALKILLTHGHTRTAEFMIDNWLDSFDWKHRGLMYQAKMDQLLTELQGSKTDLTALGFPQNLGDLTDDRLIENSELMAKKVAAFSRLIVEDKDGRDWDDELSELLDG